jgi:hypothetical protein
MKEEAVGDEHQFAITPMLTCKLDVLHHVWIQQRLATEQREPPWLQAMRPLGVIGFGVFDRRQFAGDVKVRVVTALLAG